MTTTTITEEKQSSDLENIGVQLAKTREQRGYSQEYIAGKLHLRVRMIELLEANDFDRMPEPVFVKGYLRAYAKLLGISSESVINTYNALYSYDKKQERALWQSKRESYSKARIVKWCTAVFIVIAMVSIGVWWEKNKIPQSFAATKTMNKKNAVQKKIAAMKITTISKMQSMFSANTDSLPPENPRG